MKIEEISPGCWEYFFQLNGRWQRGTRSNQREAQQAMREDLDLARTFWRRNEDEE